MSLILVVAAVLRIVHLGDHSLLEDEIWSIELAMGHDSAHDFLIDGVIHTDQPRLIDLAAAAPWWEIWTHLNGVTHPPLYFIVLRCWMDWVGTAPGPSRMLSVLFSLAAIPLLFDVCRLLHGPRVGLVAAAIMALAIVQIDYAQQTRGYTMLIFLSLGAADVLVRIEKLGATGRRVVVLALMLAVLALTHYEAAGALLALAAYAVARLRERARARALIAFAVAGVFVALVWGPFYARQLQTLRAFFTDFRDVAASRSVVTPLRLPTIFLFGEDLTRKLPLAAIVAVALLVVMLPMVRLFWRRDLLLWVLWMWATPLFVAATDLVHHTACLTYLRYTLVASPAIYAALASITRPKDHWLVGVVFIAALLPAGIIRITQPLVAVEDWQHYASFVDTNVGTDDLLVFLNESRWVSPGMWYMALKYYAPQSHRPWITLHEPADARVLQLLSKYPRVWLIGLFPVDLSSQALPGWRPTGYVHTTVGYICRMAPAPPTSTAY
jgi:uncharacterized membrane protein